MGQAIDNDHDKWPSHLSHYKVSRLTMIICVLCWLFLVGCSLLVVPCWLFLVGCSLFRSKCKLLKLWPLIVLNGLTKTCNVNINKPSPLLLVSNFIDLSSMHTLKRSFKYSIQLRQYHSTLRELILNIYITFWIVMLAKVIHIGSTVVKALDSCDRGR